MDDIFVTISEGVDNTFVSLQEGSDDIFLTVEDSYVLPTASATVKGGIKIGSGLTIADGVLSATALSQIQSDFEQSDSSKPDFIRNKPSIPSETSDLTNDSGFITISELEPYATTSGLTIALAGKSDTTHNHSLANLTEKSYNSLTDRPVIPNELKDLTDDATHRTVTDTEKSAWNNKLDSYTETDPVFNVSQAKNITSGHITLLNNTSGTNTGDETNSTIKTKLGTDLSNKLDYDGSGSNLSGITASQVGAEPSNINIQSHISATGNPHSTSKSDLGLGNIDNTSDLNKPISTATQTELNKIKNLAIAMAVAL